MYTLFHSHSLADFISLSHSLTLTLSSTRPLNHSNPLPLLFTVSGRTSAKVSARKGSVGNTQSSPSLTKNPVSSPLLSRSAPGSFMLSVQPLHSLSLSVIQNHAISSSYSSRGSRSQGTHEHAAVYPSPAPALSKVPIVRRRNRKTFYFFIRSEHD